MAAYQNLVTAEDTARIAYSDQIKQNPAAAAQFTRDTTASLKAGIMSAKQNAYAQVEQELSRAQDETANVKLYQTRTSDTDDLATQIERNNQAVAGQLADDKAMTKRQFEINEWYNYKRQSTVNIFLNLAITLGALLIAIVAWKLGFVPPGIFNGLAGLIIGYGVISTWWRYSSSDVTGQDAILWHRRRFGPSNIDPVKIKCDPLTGEIIPTIPTLNPCLDEAAKKLEQLIQTTNHDLESYMEGTTVPKGLCSSKAESFVSTSM